MQEKDLKAIMSAMKELEANDESQLFPNKKEVSFEEKEKAEEPTGGAEPRKKVSKFKADRLKEKGNK